MTEKLTIDTPEQIALEFTLAGIGSRFLALAVDTLAQVLLFLVLIAALIGTTTLLVRAGVDVGSWLPAIFVLGIFLIYYGYFAAFEMLDQGRTPGKRLVGLRAISADGRPMTAQQALVRNLVRIADSLPALYAVGLFAALLSPRFQRLGDLAAGTVVVHERPIGAAPVPAAVVRTTPLRTGGARLTPQEIGIVEAFLGRRHDMDWELRERTAATIASRLRMRLGVPPGGSDEEFLEEAVRTAGS